MQKKAGAWFMLMDSFSSLALKEFFLALGVFMLIWAGILGLWWILTSILNLTRTKPRLSSRQE